VEASRAARLDEGRGCGLPGTAHGFHLRGQCHWSLYLGSEAKDVNKTKSIKSIMAAIRKPRLRLNTGVVMIS
jgi:hypothetical protein